MFKKFRSFFALACCLSLSAPNSYALDMGKNQKYWDGSVAPSIKGGADCQKDLNAFAKANPEFMNPPLMAIGDSLYNGVQSLKINWWLSEWSVPAQIAIRLGLIDEHFADRTGKRKFYTPQYPNQGKSLAETSNYGFDLEKRGLYTFFGTSYYLATIPRSQREALKDLLEYRPPNNRGFVDNIAFSGANTMDLLYWTPKDFRDQASLSIKDLHSFWVQKKFLSLGDAFTFANAAFVLNPTNNKCIDTLTPIQHVEIRKPKRLLINIGSNNGVYLAGFLGTGIDIDHCSQRERSMVGILGKPRCVDKIKNFLESQYLEDMDKILSRLSSVDGLEYVYVNSLPLPSQTANVVFAKDAIKLDILNDRDVDSDIIESADKLVSSVNEDMKRKINSANRDNIAKGSRQRFVLVDLAKAMDKYDYKKCMKIKDKNCESKQLIIGKNFGISSVVRLDNQPLKADGDSGYRSGNNFASNIKQGGLFSFDNMHLSSVGYEIMAEKIRFAMFDAKDQIIIPQLKDRKNNCRPRNHPEAGQVKIGDCIGLLSKAGWSFTDATRREFVFARNIGSNEMRTREFFEAVMDFVN